MNRRYKGDSEDKCLSLHELRLVSDLRIMHAKVDELYYIVSALKNRHNTEAIVDYADQSLLTRDIQKVDELYLWCVALRDEANKQSY